jgi:hypothetical protein
MYYKFNSQGDAKNVGTVKPTKTYDTETSNQRQEQDINKPVFKNAAIDGPGSTNFREFNPNEDLLNKNLKDRGLDKEPEREETEEDGENKGKRKYNNNNNNQRRYNNNSRGGYNNRPRYNNNNTGFRPEKEVDEDGFEKISSNKPKQQRPFRNNNNYNNNWNKDRNDEEQKVWESVTEKREPQEGGEHEENKEGGNEGERQQREERPREYRDKNQKKPRKDQHNWDNSRQQPEPVEKEKVIEVAKPQPTKGEFTMVNIL